MPTIMITDIGMTTITISWTIPDYDPSGDGIPNSLEEMTLPTGS